MGADPLGLVADSLAEFIDARVSAAVASALVGLMSERLPIEQVRSLYRRLETRIRQHNDRQAVLHMTGKAS